MFATVPLLEEQALVYLRKVANEAVFVDGSYSNPNSKVKNNLQMSYEDDNYKSIASAVHEVLIRNEEIRLFAHPQNAAPCLMTKYTEGMFYGTHADSPIVPAGQNVMRSDVSCTIFLSEPLSYGGGELVLHLGSELVSFKPQAGWAVLYPSNLLHEVLPITFGERLALITFIESHIKDSMQREILYKLNKLKSEELSWEGRTDLSHVTACLHRMWS